MDFYEVIRTRRSVRSFNNKDIPEEVLSRVLDAARIAPSGSNRQPWKFIVIRDAAARQKMVPLCEGQAFVAAAPALIVACGRNIHYNRGGYMGDHSMLVDVAIAVDHLTLAARAEGLGTCWIGSFRNQETKKELGIPDNYDVVALTPLGYPAQPDAFNEDSGRNDLEEIVSYETFE